jgi:sugar-specific transcriptional regulator TrmB
MRHLGSRTICVNKTNLIAKIKENKENHIKEYEKAIIAYKEEALKQLEELTKKVEEGALDVKLDLITPINNAENYDKIIEMFTWEVEDIVTLEQSEFIEYVQDETDFAVKAKLSNTFYASSR